MENEEGQKFLPRPKWQKNPSLSSRRLMPELNNLTEETIGSSQLSTLYEEWQSESQRKVSEDPNETFSKFKEDVEDHLSFQEARELTKALKTGPEEAPPPLSVFLEGPGAFYANFINHYVREKISEGAPEISLDLAKEKRWNEIILAWLHSLTNEQLIKMGISLRVQEGASNVDIQKRSNTILRIFNTALQIYVKTVPPKITQAEREKTEEIRKKRERLGYQWAQIVADSAAENRTALANLRNRAKDKGDSGDLLKDDSVDYHCWTLGESHIVFIRDTQAKATAKQVEYEELLRSAGYSYVEGEIKIVWNRIGSNIFVIDHDGSRPHSGGESHFDAIRHAIEYSGAPGEVISLEKLRAEEKRVNYSKEKTKIGEELHTVENQRDKRTRIATYAQNLRNANRAEALEGHMTWLEYNKVVLAELSEGEEADYWLINHGGRDSFLQISREEYPDAPVDPLSQGKVTLRNGKYIFKNHTPEPLRKEDVDPLEIAYEISDESSQEPPEQAKSEEEMIEGVNVRFAEED